VLLFGGSDEGFLGDTWAWNGETWRELQPAHGPSPRISMAFVADEARGTVVLFGGFVPEGEADDTWEWDGEDWRQLDVLRSPPGRMRAGAAYDSHHYEVVLYGGASFGPTLGDTWVLPSLADDRPAHVLTVDFGDARVPEGTELQGLTASFVAGGSGRQAGAPVAGAELLVWHTGDGAWLPVASNDDSEPGLLRWPAPDPAGLPELLFRDGFRFAVAPVGTNGSSYAEVATDYAEVVVRYRLP